MKKEYLLDANDAFKKMVFGWLLPNLRCLHVIPMITNDPNVWTAAHWDLYAQLFGIPASSVLARQSQFTNAIRVNYFSALPKANSSVLCANADLFLDPDGGLTDTGGGDTHVNAAEVADLLRGSDRVAIVYQHSNRDKGQIAANLKKHCCNIQKALQQNNPQQNNQTLHTFGIHGASICLFFFSLDQGRLNVLKAICVHQFGPMKSDRVI